MKTTSTAVNKTEDSSAEQVHHNPVYFWYVVFVLMACWALALVDLQILSLLVDPMKAYLGINATQFGLLQGLPLLCFIVLRGCF
jgi:cyanate permease